MWFSAKKPANKQEEEQKLEVHFLIVLGTKQEISTEYEDILNKGLQRQ